MSAFFQARIHNDLENLAVPINYTLREKMLTFTVDINTNVYRRKLEFDLFFPEEYPFKSPKLRCKTKVFHPNIDEEGNVCLKILKDGWTAAYDLNSIIISLLCAFEFLSGEDALNTEAGDLLEANYHEFVKRAQTMND